MSSFGNIFGTLLTAILAVSVSGNLQAALVAFDGFEDYSVGDQLEDGSDNGLNGGVGWTDEWNVNGTSRRSDLTIVSGGLSFNKGTVVNKGGDRALRLLMSANEGGTPHIVNRPFPTQSGTMYMSLLFETATADIPAGDDFVQYGMDSSNANPRTSVSHRINTGLDPDDFDFHSRAGTGGNGFADIGTVANQTYFLVIRARDTGGDTNYDVVDLWVDPLSPNPGPPDGTEGGGAGISSLSQFVHRIAFLETGDQYVIDNVRIGSSFASVIPTPEPSTLLIWSLLAGLGIGLGWRRRR